MSATCVTCKLARLCQHAIAFSIAGSQSERGERWRARPFLTKTRPLPEVRKMADAYSTERERSTLEIIRTALRDAALVPTVYDAFGVTAAVLRRPAEFAGLEARYA